MLTTPGVAARRIRDFSGPSVHRRRLSYPALARAGLTLIELLIALAIVAVIAAIAVPSYTAYLDRALVAQAMGDIRNIETDIARYHADHRGFPATLADIGKGALLDPWKNPYQYLDLTEPKNKGHARKDKNLVPINTDFDLYSKGKNGTSVAPLTAAHSRDDIVRGNNGRFVGLASDY
jgi:general secretion pathway protein G